MQYGELKFAAAIATFMVAYSLGACEKNPAVEAAEERAEAEAAARGEGLLDQHFAGEVAEEKKRLELEIERQNAEVAIERQNAQRAGVLPDAGLDELLRDAGDDSGTPIPD